MQLKTNKTKIIAIMQPTYLPWMGYFDLMDQCDIFVFLDSVQFNRRSWQQRNQIRTIHGKQMLTVPVLSKGMRNQLIKDVKIDQSQDFAKKHIRAIQSAYSKTMFYKNYAGDLASILEENHEFLCALNINIICWLSKALGISREMMCSSYMKTSGSKASLLLSICQSLGATHYLSAAGSKEYIENDNVFLELCSLN